MYKPEIITNTKEKTQPDIGIISRYKPETTTKTRDATKNWTTYNNSTYGYIISYPSNWITGEEPTNGDGVALYDDGGNEVLVYGELINPEYPDDYIEGGKILLQKPFKLMNGEKGELLYIDDGNGRTRYIMHVEIKSYRYVIYASVSEVFLKNNRNTLDKIMESLVPSWVISETICTKEKLNQLNKEEIFGSFEEYHIAENFKGKFAPLDLESSFIAKRFKTMINDALSENKINFAGHYVIAEWGFTGVGGMMAVIDVINGKAYPLPYVNKFGLDYRSDSNLIILDSLPILIDSQKDPQFNDNYRICSSYSKDVRPYYFVFENNAFRLLGPKDSPFPYESYLMKP